MGSIIHHVKGELPLPNGLKMVIGKLNFSTSYANGGDALNLYNYFNPADASFVLQAGGCQNALDKNFGIVAAHNGGNAENGKLLALIYSGLAGVPGYLGEVNIAISLAGCNVPFVAVGEPRLS